MGISQAVSFVLIMILALYGLATLVDRIGMRLLRPRCFQLTLMLKLDSETTDAEMQLRAALQTSRYLSVPLTVVDEGMDIESRTIVDTLLKKSTGEWSKPSR